MVNMEHGKRLTGINRPQASTVLIEQPAYTSKRVLFAFCCQGCWTTLKLLSLKIAFPPLLSSFTFHLPSGCFFITVPICPFLSFNPSTSTRAPSTSTSSTLGCSLVNIALSDTLARTGHPPSGSLDFFVSTSCLSSGPLSGICN